MKLALMVFTSAALTGCVTSSQQDTAQTQIISQWKNCVVTSYVSNRRSGVEKNLAVESAFFACRTEEAAITARYAYDPQFYFQMTQVVAAQKPSIKAQLMAAG